jgi:diguanylate cyclase (GGDEF)-like protein
MWNDTGRRRREYTVRTLVENRCQDRTSSCMNRSPNRENQTDTRILVIGPAGLQTDTLVDLLSREGYETSSTPNAGQAKQTLQADRFDLALIDTLSPEFDGFDLCQNLKTGPKPPYPRVILMVSLPAMRDFIRSLQTGADYTVATPVHHRTLLSAVRYVLSPEYSSLCAEPPDRLPLAVEEETIQVPATRLQLLNLLMTTHQAATEWNLELSVAQTELKERNLQLRDKTKKLAMSEQNLRMVLEDNADGMVVLDLTHRVQFANSAAKALLGRTDANLRGSPFGFAVTPGTSEEVAISLPGREPIIVELKAAYTIWEGETAYLASLRDITQRRLQEEQFMEQHAQLQVANAQLQVLAAFDGLTSLHNRRSFMESIEEECRQAQENGTPLSLSLLDVDHFKAYNDTHGHTAGDEVLISVARLLKGAARRSDMVARFGGEEFVIILPGCGPSNAAAHAERIRRIIESAVWPKRPITTSVGVATLSRDISNPADLIAAADKALYYSKHHGRNLVTHADTLPSKESTPSKTDAP